jgi:uncharacterized protein
VTASLVTLGDERSVSLTAFLRTGGREVTPVWVVRDGDALVASTVLEASKITRFEYDDHVELRACDRHGRVPEGAPAVPASVVLDESAEAVRSTERLLAIKYGWQYRVGRLQRSLRRRLGRPTSSATRVVLRLHPM